LSGDPARARGEFPAEVGGSTGRLTRKRRPGIIGGRLIAVTASAVMVGLLTVSISGVFAAGGGHVVQPASKPDPGASLPGHGGGGGHLSQPGHGGGGGGHGGHASKPGHGGGGGGGGHRSPPGHGGHASKPGHG
jgi:hypothetical protein